MRWEEDGTTILLERLLCLVLFRFPFKCVKGNPTKEIAAAVTIISLSLAAAFPWWPPDKFFLPVSKPVKVTVWWASLFPTGDQRRWKREASRQQNSSVETHQ